MTEIKGFIMSLITVSAASALIEGFTPNGGMKKYIRYLISLMILLVLLTPIKGLFGIIPLLAANTEFSYDSVEAFASANSIVARHIEGALTEKFSLADSEVDVRYNGEGIVVNVKKRLGLIESDFRDYIAANFGILTEVSFYE